MNYIVKCISVVTLVFLSTVLTLSFSLDASAQVLGSLDASSVRVDDLTNEQVQMINERIKGEGLSIDEAMSLAQAQGMPSSEVTKLRLRLNTVGTFGGEEDSLSTTTIDALNLDDIVEEIPSDLAIPDNPVEARTSNLSDSQMAMDIDGTDDIYGHSIFTNQSLELFTTTDGARAPSWYVLGTGDQIRITIFGVSQADLLLEVSDEGYIQPTGMPRIFLKGLTIAQSEKLLRDRLSDFYTFEAEEFSLTIKVARTLTLNIFGETALNGSFTISALNTALNALTVAGGPTSRGTVRSIQHIRGTEKTEIDLYSFMKDPSIQTEYDLRHHDILFVPMAEKIVRLRGAVKRPMRYELKGDEGFLDLLSFAGGVRSDTSPDYIQIQRIEQGEPRLFEYSLSDLMEREDNLSLKDGDVITIRQIDKDLEQFVGISGMVYYPGTYDYAENRQLKTLLEKAEIRPQAVMEKAIIQRLKDDGSTNYISVSLEMILQDEETFELEPEDRVRVFNQSQYSDVTTIEIAGSVRTPVQIPIELNDRLRLADALFMSDGLLTTAAPIAFVFRPEFFNPEIVRHLRVDVTQDAAFELRAGDRLVVYDQRDYTNLGELTIGGAVGEAISTVYEPTLSISDLLVMAGGITRDAALDRLDVFRLDVSFRSGTSYDIINLTIDDSLNLVNAPPNFQLQPFDRIIVRRIPEFNIGSTVQIDGEVKYPGSYPLESRKVRLSEILREAGGLTNSADARHAVIFRTFGGVGPIAVDLNKALGGSTTGDRHDPVLLDGDVITIPQLQNTVTINLNATGVGELQSIGVVDTETELGARAELNVIYKGGKSARWYIQNFAGGFAKDADKWSVTVTRPNGEVQSTKRRMLLFRDYPSVVPGSTITLRFEPEEPEVQEQLINWDEVQARTTQVTTTILTFLILLDRLTGTN